MYTTVTCTRSLGDGCLQLRTSCRSACVHWCPACAVNWNFTEIGLGNFATPLVCAKVKSHNHAVHSIITISSEYIEEDTEHHTLKVLPMPDPGASLGCSQRLQFVAPPLRIGTTPCSSFCDGKCESTSNSCHVSGLLETSQSVFKSALETSCDANSYFTEISIM